MRTKRPLPPEEPPAAPKPAAAKKKPPAPAPQKPRAPLSTSGPVADRAGEKRVRRGQLEIAMRLDLHGHTQDRARAALHGFLLDAQARGESVVLVITGKGRAGEEGVLKRRLPDWLAAPPLRALVAGQAQAHARHGGAGAVYVFVKSPK